MTDWKVRAAVADDAAPIKRLWQETDNVHASLLPGILTGFPIPEIPAGDDDLMLVATDDSGAVCGFRYLRLIDEIPGFRPRRRAVNSAIAVTKRVRGQGCGRTLVEAGEAWARERGATEAIVTVWAGNLASRGLFLDGGYQPIAESLWKELGAK